jgi:enoyl-CoA hydratase
MAKTMELALTGEPISAAIAIQLGLVARITSKGSAMQGALDLAGKIAANAPLPVQISKRIVRSAVGLTDKEGWILQSPD